MGVVVVIVILVVVVAAAIPLGIWLGRRGRGSLQLEIPGTAFRPGDYIDGAIHLEAKKALGPGRLRTALVCTEEWWEWETDADGDQRREKKTREVFRHEVDVVPSLTMDAGERRTIPFSLPTPPPDIPTDQPTSKVMEILTSLSEIMRADRDQRWDVEARYDLRGLDLVGDRRVNFYEG